jgi:hypothetical protein
MFIIMLHAIFTVTIDPPEPQYIGTVHSKRVGLFFFSEYKPDDYRWKI